MKDCPQYYRRDIGPIQIDLETFVKILQERYSSVEVESGKKIYEGFSELKQYKDLIDVPCSVEAFSDEFSESVRISISRHSSTVSGHRAAALSAQAVATKLGFYVPWYAKVSLARLSFLLLAICLVATAPVAFLLWDKEFLSILGTKIPTDWLVPTWSMISFFMTFWLWEKYYSGSKIFHNRSNSLWRKHAPLILSTAFMALVTLLAAVI